jgi:hypothetical protein
MYNGMNDGLIRHAKQAQKWYAQRKVARKALPKADKVPSAS